MSEELEPGRVLNSEEENSEQKEERCNQTWNAFLQARNALQEAECARRDARKVLDDLQAAESRAFKVASDALRAAREAAHGRGGGGD